MREEVLFTLDTPYRQPLAVKGWFFGAPGKMTLAVMGALRGNEIQQMYLCSQLIQHLAALEQSGALSDECGILVIPCANQFSMNVGRRFWAADNTDINRMFPGYDAGETTQRIAAQIFEALQGYTYGIHVTSLYLPGGCLPHLRIMKTGYQTPETARDFGLPYIVLRDPHPYDTTTLNYNWQIWDTETFSLYTPATDHVDAPTAQQGVEAILRFLQRRGFCRCGASAGEQARIFGEESLWGVKPTLGGLLVHRVALGSQVWRSQPLADVLDPCSGAVRQTLRAPVDGRVFFAHEACLINGYDVAMRLLPDETEEEVAETSEAPEESEAKE